MGAAPLWKKALSLALVAGGLLAAGCENGPGIAISGNPGATRPTEASGFGPDSFPFGLGADLSDDPGVVADEDGPLGLASDFAIQSSLPPAVDLRPQCSPVRNQGRIFSCTAFATLGLHEFLLLKRGRYLPQSSAYIYYQTRKRMGNIGFNPPNGPTASTWDALEALDSLGAPEEEAFSYLDPAFHKNPEAIQEFLNRRPSADAVRQAQKNRVLTGFRFRRQLSAVRRSLAGGLPAILDMEVFEGIEKTGPDGMLPLPGPGQKRLGGHAVLAVGYDSRRSLLVIKNSWGEGWGDRGYFYMPYEYVRRGHVTLAVTPIAD